MALRELGQQDFSGGINAVASPYRLTETQVYRARNLLLDEHGSLTTRPGYSVVYTSADTNNPIVLSGVRINVDGSRYPYIVQTDGTTMTLTAIEFPAGSNSVALPATSLIPQAVEMNDSHVFATGYVTPQTWANSGAPPVIAPITATGGQTVPPGAQHIAFHLSALWVWNTNATTTTLDGPSSLRASDPNNFNSWPNTNQTFISKDDGQTGQGLASYTIAETGISPTTTLVAFKDYSSYQVTGVFGSSNFAVQKIKTDLGCVAPRTIQFVSGFGIVRLSHKGFALFNGVDDRLLSEEVRPYLFGRDDITSINWAQVFLGQAGQNQNPPLYVAALPLMGPFLTRIFVYDLVRRAWMICDLPVPIQSLNVYAVPSTLTVPSSQPELRAGTSTSGRLIRVFYVTDTTDNGTAIPWTFTTKKFGSPMRASYWRRALVDILYTPPQTLDVATELESPNTNVTGTLTYNATFAGGDYGSAVYGSSAYGQTSQECGVESLDINRTATVANLTVDGTGNVRIRALGFEVAPKPLTRKATVGAV